MIIYPVWWGSVPALLKGFIDRTLLPGAAFKYHTKDPFWDKQLSRKTAHVITTSDAPAIWLWWQYSNSDIKAIKKATLEFCGIKRSKQRASVGSNIWTAEIASVRSHGYSYQSSNDKRAIYLFRVSRRVADLHKTSTPAIVIQGPLTIDSAI